MSLWTATIDNNTYSVLVSRSDENYKAVLEVYRVEDGELIHSEEVSLAYNAMFGPDVDDVAAWEEIAIRVVDGQ